MGIWKYHAKHPKPSENIQKLKKKEWKQFWLFGPNCIQFTQVPRFFLNVLNVYIYANIVISTEWRKSVFIQKTNVQISTLRQMYSFEIVNISQHKLAYFMAHIGLSVNKHFYGIWPWNRSFFKYEIVWINHCTLIN